ncbi:MAG: hypothetical protein Kow00121_68710 [Elainellaceae cyanobacterium]
MVNTKTAQIFGKPVGQILGRDDREFLPADIAQQLMDNDRMVISSGVAQSVEELVITQGQRRVYWSTKYAWRSPDGSIQGLIGIARDVTKRKQTDRLNAQLYEQTRRYAFYDMLTGLPQRPLLLERLYQLTLAHPSQPIFTLFHLDLARFQLIKYSLGHQIAEQFLIAIARRLEAYIQPQTLLTRVGADEFVILAESITELDQAIEFAEQLQQAVATPIALNEHEIFTTANIGIVRNSAILTDPEDLLRAADTAMHQAKIANGSGYAVFNSSMQTEAIRRLRIATDLRQAIVNQEIQIHYQPIVSVFNQTLVGFEALARWQHPNLGMLPPSEFIALAEENGLITPLGISILRQACAQVKLWQQQFPQHSSLYLSVNVSPVQLRHPELVSQIEHILQETEFQPHQLRLEITESAVMENTRWIAGALERLKAQQIRLCIDDFGTGYSSLSYLHSFPFHVLKVDRSFVSRMGDDLESLEIVRAIIVLAHALKMEVIAEGIETVQQLEYLQSLGCEYGQGYLFSRPLPPSEIAAFIEAEQWRV